MSRTAEYNFGKNVSLRAAGLGVMVVALTGCSLSEPSPFSLSHTGESSTDQASAASANLSVEEQHKLGVRYMLEMEGNLTVPIQLPTQVTNPATRQHLLHAADSLVAAYTVTADEHNGGEHPEYITQMQAIQEPLVREATQRCLAELTADHLQLDLYNNDTSSATTATDYLKEVLVDKPAEFAGYETAAHASKRLYDDAEACAGALATQADDVKTQFFAHG